MNYIERDEGMAEQEKEILEEEMVEETADEAVEAEDTSEEAEESAEETTEETEEVPEGEEPKTWAEKRAAKKQKKEQANADKERIAELEDKVKRQLAEFENFRNRTEKEKQAMFETGAKSVLEKIGVKPIEAVGQEFDPNLHNAVMQVESEEFESGIVAQELMKGYMYRDSVVRHSMVGVVS